MHRSPLARAAAAFAATCTICVTTSCTRFGAVYPKRPEVSVGEPVTEPLPSRVVTHLTITSVGLKSSLDAGAPSRGQGTFPMLGTERPYTWERTPFTVKFLSGRVTIETDVTATLAFPVHTATIPLHVRVEAAPIVSSGYKVKLQDVAVKVASESSGLAFADAVAHVYASIEKGMEKELTDFSFDLRPMLEQAGEKLSRPNEFTVGDAHACASLRVLAIESGPTLFADGLEKDLAIVIAPEVTLPCPTTQGEAPPLPPLSNVAAVPPGPFTVTVPVVAQYDELARAMTATFTDGKLFFSKEYPELYLESPSVYESDGALVLKLHIAGPVRGHGVSADIDGDLFLTGHPQVVDNELRIPDLEPTIETANFLLMIKAATDTPSMRDDARKALRLDLSERLHAVRAKLSSELTFQAGPACLEADVHRIAVSGVHAHARYLRLYVDVTAQSRVSVPCTVIGASRNE